VRGCLAYQVRQPTCCRYWNSKPFSLDRNPGEGGDGIRHGRVSGSNRYTRRCAALGCDPMDASPNEPNGRVPIIVTFDLQLLDVQQGLGALPRARWAKVAAWIGILTVGALVAWRVHEGRDPGVMVAVGVFLVAALFIGRDPAKRIAKRVYANLPEVERHVELKFDQEGIQTNTGAQATLTPWSRVMQVVEARHTFVLFESRSNAQLVPKRAMTNEQCAELRELIRQRVVPRKDPWLTRQVAVRLVIYALLFVALWLFFRNRQ